MGIQRMDSLAQHDSFLGISLREAEKHLTNKGKSLGTMSVDELLTSSIWTAESSHSYGADESATSSLRRQASWSLARAFRGKTVEEVWRDIQQGCKRSNLDVFAPNLGDMTLEDFLVQGGMYVASTSSIEPVMSLDSALKTHKFSGEMGLSPSVPNDVVPDTPVPGQKRGVWEFERSVERRLRRKMKNRESAARSRARKQAYQNELAVKVSSLEEENLKLKREKEFDDMIPDPKPRFQLRRTSSF